MPMGKVQLIPFIALIVLVIAGISSVYVYATQTNTDVIKINGQSYTIDQLFYLTKPRAFPSLNSSGIALDDLIIKTGVSCPACHDYTFTAKDGYQKTVTWENMKNGLLTKEGKTVFSDLPKAFRIKDVVSIEVK